MGALSILNAIKEQKVVGRLVKRELMYVNLDINGMATIAVVDIGATHNFISREEAKQLGLKLEKDSSKMKAINYEAKPIHNVDKGVGINIGGWKGTTNLSVVPLDDFKVIFGMEFLSAAKVVHMPHLGMLSIIDEGASCMISAITKGKKCETMPQKGRGHLPCCLEGGGAK